jgi:hypothetical protein
MKQEWNEECSINDIELDVTSLDVPRLHAKYSEYLTDWKLVEKRLNLKYKELLKNKWLWYNGKLSQQEIDDLGWSYDPFNGLKIMKGDFNYFFESDKDLQAIRGKMDTAKVTIEYLIEIIDMLKWRHQTIKNIIEWRKFMAGA